MLVSVHDEKYNWLTKQILVFKDEILVSNANMTLTEATLSMEVELAKLSDVESRLFEIIKTGL